MQQDFAQRITESQRKLYGYIYSLTGNSASSWDILQETNIVLWKKQDQFQPGTRFDSWAFTIARFQVLAFLRDRKREPLCMLTPELLDAFSEQAESEAHLMDDRLKALESCRMKLSERGRNLLTLHYDQGLSMAEIGKKLKTSTSAVKQAIFRTRRLLLDCIETSVAPES